MGKIDKLGRKPYAKKIAQEINTTYENQQKEDPKERENLIFAISGKWGEGKTILLHLLKKELEDKKFKVIEFNPWKYSQQDIALKRAFLNILNNELHDENDHVDLDDLYFDRSKFGIQKNLVSKAPNIVIATLAIIWGLIFLSIYIPEVKNFFTGGTKFIHEIVKTLLTLIAIPIIIKFTFFDKRGSSISTAEEFESKFNKILDGKKKIVIFIDDLDRCTAKTVKVVLDSLKTFFLHPECSYVITGDHTVIEKYATEEVAADITNTIQRTQEGRRYLKKLFDIYWRLPLPTPNQLNSFVDTEIEKCDISIPDDQQKQQLKTFLRDDDFFNRNPRHIKRFIKKIAFTLESLELQKSNLEESENEDESTKQIIHSINEIKDHPNLLAKVLLLEELCFPLYEKLVINPTIYAEHEKIARRKYRGENYSPEALKIGNKSITEILEKDEGMISTYESIIDMPPTFTNEDDTLIFEVSDYFYFSGATGLPSAKGPDVSRFAEYLKSGLLMEKLGESLKGSITKEKQEELMALAKKTIPESLPSEINIGMNALREILKLIRYSNEWSEELKFFYEQYLTLDEAHRNELKPLLLRACIFQRPDLIPTLTSKTPELETDLLDIWQKLEVMPPTESGTQMIEIVKKKLNPDSPDGGAASMVLDSAQITEEQKGDLREYINKQAQDPENGRKYLLRLPKDTEPHKLAENQMRANIEVKTNFEWCLGQIQFLKEQGLLNTLKASALKYAKDTIDDFKKVMALVDQLELTEPEEMQSLFDTMIEHLDTNKNALVKDIDFKGYSVRWSPLQKKSLFKRIVEIFKGKTNDEELRKSAGDELKKNQKWWNGLDASILTDEVSQLNIIDLKDQEDLIALRKAILESWGLKEENENPEGNEGKNEESEKT